jgi:hypothetical protein
MEPKRNTNALTVLALLAVCGLFLLLSLQNAEGFHGPRSAGDASGRSPTMFDGPRIPFRR